MTTLAAVAFFALLVFLGQWQLARATEKETRQALFEARAGAAPVQLGATATSAEDLLYRRVRASGRWIAERQIFVDNQIREGRAGFTVVAPLQLAGRQEAVLVSRGWIARSPDYPRPPAVPVPVGLVEVVGIASLPPARFLELSAQVVDGAVWQNLSIERFKSSSGLALLPIVVLDATPPAGLSALREKPDAGVARHQEYALTWFSLAATTLVLWIALNLRRVR